MGYDGAVKITLPYPPSANHYYTIARGRKILSSKGREFLLACAAVCADARIKPIDGPVSYMATAYRPRKIGDLDNLIKPVQDALKGWAWHDDKQVDEFTWKRRDDKHFPRIEIEIRPSSPP